jgi:hypothetical protein
VIPFTLKRVGNFKIQKSIKCFCFLLASDRFQLFAGYYSTVVTSSFGPFIGRSMTGYYNTNQCLTECFFTPANDCHFAVNSGSSCNIGTFKLWPIENPPAYASTTVYIFNGKNLCIISDIQFILQEF